MKKISLYLAIVIVYISTYYLLYTYSILGIDILFPINLVIYFTVIFIFIVMYYFLKDELNNIEDIVIMIIFSFVPIIMVNTIFLEPLLSGPITGASTSLEDLFWYLKSVPWNVFKGYELSTLFIKLPSLVALIFSIAILIVKLKEQRMYLMVGIYLYLLLLIPYLLYLEKWIPIGV